MALIKSALELALERTKDIAGDKQSLKAKQLKEEGMRLFTSIMEKPDFDARKQLETFPKDDQPILREGLFTVLMNRIQLPSSELALGDLEAVERGLTALMPKEKHLKDLRAQLEEFYSQYLADREQLYDAIVQQYAPVLRQKEQQLAAKTGQRVTLTPDQDPEFQNFAKKNIDRLDSQYNESINQLKEQISQFFHKK